jgi:hypothetical protein
MGKIGIRTIIRPDIVVRPENILRFPAREPRVVALVANLVRVDCHLPYFFSAGCSLENAKGVELEMVRSRLAALSPDENPNLLRNLYEHEDIAIQTPSGTGYTWQPLPQVDWKYYVLKSKDRGAEALTLHQLSNITSTPIDLQSLLLYNATDFRYHEADFKRHHSGGGQTRTVTTINYREIEILRTLFARWGEMDLTVANGDRAYPEISRALQMFDDLSLLAPHSDFQFLALFAIVEMLVTHEPEGNGDASITNQIRRKMPILTRRFDEPIVPPSEIQDASSEKIWGALYDLRSNLAHGSLANFSHGKHAVLKRQELACEYLTSTVAALIRQSIHDPQLLRDLKAV